MARVLVTRPLEDAEPLVARLQALGHQVVVEPLLEIVWRSGPMPDLTSVQGLLFTSANGVRAFSRLVFRRDIPVYAVGDATAAVARAAGFSFVVSAAGDVRSLAHVVARQCDSTLGPLLHVAASVQAGDLAGMLAAVGITIQRTVLYEAKPALALSATTRSAFASAGLDAVLLFSPRTAQTLVDLIVAAGQKANCERIVAVCLSAAVADVLSGREVHDGIPAWLAVRVAQKPTQDALLAALG